jgi:hypothetical protein
MNEEYLNVYIVKKENVPKTYECYIPINTTQTLVKEFHGNSFQDVVQNHAFKEVTEIFRNKNEEFKVKFEFFKNKSFLTEHKISNRKF